MVQIPLIILGILTIAFGIWQISDTESAWKIARFHRRASGLNDERTPEWETSNKIGGFLTIGGGILILSVGLLFPQKKSQEQEFEHLLTPRTFSTVKDGNATDKIVEKDITGKTIYERRLTTQEQRELEKNKAYFLLKESEKIR